MNKKLLTYTITTIYIIFLYISIFVKSVTFCLIICGLFSIGSLWLDYFLDKWREKPIKPSKPIKENAPKNEKKIEPIEPSPTDVIHSGTIISEEELIEMENERKKWFSQMSGRVTDSVDKIERLLKGESDGTETEEQFKPGCK